MPQFNQSIPLLSRPKYAEGTKLSSTRDDRNNSFLWKKGALNTGQIDSTNQALSKLSRQFSQFRRVRAGGYMNQPAQSFEVIQPFTIYQIDAAPIIIENTGTGYSANDVLTATGGTGTSMQLTVGSVNAAGNVLSVVISTQGNYSVQPTYPNSPSGGTGTGFSFSLGTENDNWRSFQIRDGFVTARSKYWLNGVNQASTANPFLVFGSPWGVSGFPYLLQNYGNGETPIYVIGDAQGIASTALNEQPISAPCAVRISRTSDLLVYGRSGANIFTFNQIVLPNDWDSNSDSRAAISFWIELIDDATNGFGANLWARVCGNQGGGIPSTQSEPFPKGPNIIPIGIADALYTATSGISFSPLNETDYYQLQSSCCANRFARVGSNAIGSQITYRGAWTADSLANQVFYAGDIVIDDTVKFPTTTSGTDIVYSYQIFICEGDPGTGSECLPFFGTSAPSADTTRWKYYADQLTSPP